MIKQYLQFTKNGINSWDMGVTHVSIDSGLYQDNIGANRNIVEMVNTQTDRRYFKRISRDPVELDMNLMLDENMSDDEIDSVMSWLINEYYEELYFEDEVDKIYYVLPSTQPQINHNGNNQGYITIKFRCYDGFIYSREINQTFDLSSNTTNGTNITLFNDGHMDIYPLITINVKDTNITILNLTTNESTQLTNLSNGENITLDNETEEITTDIPGTYRFDNINDVFIRILTPSTQFKVTGKCVLTFAYRYKRKF